VDLPVQRLPVHYVRQPAETQTSVEQGPKELPVHVERVYYVEIDAEGNCHVVHAVGVLEVDGGILDIVAGVEQQLSLSVEFNRL